MEQNQASQYVALYGGRFPAYTLNNLYSQLERMNTAEASICMAQTKDPIMVLLISIFVGSFGIDRLYVSDTVLGILKLITCGGLGIWTVIDWFLIMGVTKDKNYATFSRVCG